MEAWGRSDTNPAGAWYRLKRGFRGGFGRYISLLMEALGLAEVTHETKTIKCGLNNLIE